MLFYAPSWILFWQFVGNTMLTSFLCSVAKGSECKMLNILFNCNWNWSCFSRWVMMIIVFSFYSNISIVFVNLQELKSIYFLSIIQCFVWLVYCLYSYQLYTQLQNRYDRINPPMNQIVKKNTLTETKAKIKPDLRYFIFLFFQQ